MEGAASSQLVRMPGLGANAPEEPRGDSGSALGAPAAEEKPEAAKRKREKSRKTKKSRSPKGRVARALPAPATPEEIRSSSRQLVSSPLSHSDTLPSTTVEINSEEITRDAKEVSEQALVIARDSSNTSGDADRLSSRSSAIRPGAPVLSVNVASESVASAVQRPLVVQWPWRVRVEPHQGLQLLLEDIPVIRLLESDVMVFVEQQKMRWQTLHRELHCPTDPQYSLVGKERMGEWVYAAVQFDRYLRQRIEMSPDAAWMGALRIRHVCLPVPSDLRVFDVPLHGLTAPEIVAVFQTALDEAGYEFVNLAPDWFTHDGVRDVAEDAVRREIDDLLTALRPVVEMWRWVVEHATCNIMTLEQPFVHVEEVEDIEMPEVDAEGDVLMIEGAEEVLTTDLIVRVRTISDRRTENTSTSSDGVPRKRLQRRAFVPGSDMSLPSGGMGSNASSESHFHSPGSWDQNMSEGSGFVGFTSGEAIVGPSVMMAHAMQPAVASQHGPDMLVLTQRHLESNVKSALLPTLPASPPRPVTPLPETQSSHSLSALPADQGDHAELVLNLQQQVKAMEDQARFVQERMLRDAELERQRFAQERRVWEDHMKQQGLQLQKQSQDAEEMRRLDKTHMWALFQQEATARYKDIQREAEERRLADLKAADHSRQVLERQFHDELRIQQQEFQRQQEKWRLQQERERSEQQSLRREQEDRAKQLEAELRQLRMARTTVPSPPVTLPLSPSVAPTVSTAVSFSQAAPITSARGMVPPVTSNYTTSAVYPPVTRLTASSATFVPSRSHRPANVAFGYGRKSSETSPTDNGRRSRNNPSDNHNGPSGSLGDQTGSFGGAGGGPGGPGGPGGHIGYGNGPGGNGSGYGGNGPNPPRGSNSYPRSSQPSQATTPAPAPVVSYRTMLPYNSIPTFDGEGPLEDRKKWWNQFSYSADACCWSAEEKCKALPRWLEGSARAWYQAKDSTTRLSWKVLSKAFQDQFCTSSDSVMERYIAMMPRRGEKPLYFLWRLNAAAGKAQVDITSAKNRQKHIKRFLQKVNDKSVRFNFASRVFFSMQEFEEALQVYTEVTGGEDEREIDSLYRNETPKAVQFKKQELTAGRYRPREGNPQRAYRAQEFYEEEDDYDQYREDDAEESTYAAQATSPRSRPSFNSPKSVYPSGGQQRSTLRPGTFTSGRDPCTKCGRPSHSTEDCWQDLKCENCGERGHPTDRCFKRSLECELCGQQHRFAKCPMLKDFFAWMQEKNALNASPKAMSVPQVPTTPPSVNPSPLN